jgi:hypothetical protein
MVDGCRLDSLELYRFERIELSKHVVEFIVIQCFRLQPNCMWEKLTV